MVTVQRCIETGDAVIIVAGTDAPVEALPIEPTLEILRRYGAARVQ